MNEDTRTMYVTHLKLKNWRNFQNVDLPLFHRSYVLGPNASGKSNLLDVFCFLRDICKSAGGGLQKAVADRGGIDQLRCLQARRDAEVSIELHFSDRIDAATPSWRYMLGFKSEGKRNPQLRVSSESVWRGEKSILSRPDRLDREDVQLLTETHLEQIRANGEFRDIADFFRDTTYLHLVPQLLKFRNKIAGHQLEDDPFGQGFLERVAKCPERTREARLHKISGALSAAIPHFKALRFTKDTRTATPHLEARYEQHRPHVGWQREEHFSDGTLRLLSILWALLEGPSLLLIEEPELSLHQAVVEQIPLLIDRMQRPAKHRRQVIISTHSEALLNNNAIDTRGVLILEPGRKGTQIRSVSDAEKKGLEAGLSVADVVFPQTRPEKVEQLGLWQ